MSKEKKTYQFYNEETGEIIATIRAENHDIAIMQAGVPFSQSFESWSNEKETP